MQAEVLKSLGHPTRLKIIELLRGGERCVCELIAALGLEQSNVSQHLGILRKAGLVACRKDGLRVMYRLTDPRVIEVTDLVRAMLVARAKKLTVLT
ncbi:MAG TPA: ArsR family transcriptional regulator [Peptococcaceae bacterium]|nr:ArsR family transcriptional regulator [Peptococcaceae bacterium]